MNAINDHFLVTALGHVLLGTDGSPGVYTGLAIDSRKVEPGHIFVALSGAQSDGHNFIDAAVEKGAKAIICRADWSGKPRDGLRYYRVQDTFAALRTLASAWRSQLQCPVIAVAGSVGKTTTKEMIAALLRGAFANVVATKGSENGFIGIPLTLLNTPLDCQALVVEIGIDAPGAMIQHLDMVRPTAGIVTAIAPEHLEQLGDIETVAREENLCLRWIHERGGTAVINMDDPHIAPLRHELIGGHVVSFGFAGSPNQKHVSGSIVDDHSGHQIKVCGLGTQDMDMILPLPLPGAHNARNLLGSFALTSELGLTPGALAAGLATFTPAEGRSVLRSLPSGPMILCDYYNASPAAMTAAFETIAPLAQKRGGRLIACLGDMLELGPEEEKLHRDLATLIIDHRFALVVAVGPRMAWLFDELKKRQFVGQTTLDQSPDHAGQMLLTQLQPNDVVLIKGSRGMTMEKAYKAMVLGQPSI